MVAAAVALVALALASVAIAKQFNRIVLRGPISNKIGQAFSIDISGYASSPVNRVVAGEQTQGTLACAVTYAAEFSRPDYFPELNDKVGKNKRFQGLTVHFLAAHPGTHALCAYLINNATDKTYAHAGRKWNNHT